MFIEKADCTITMNDDDLFKLMTGALNAQKVGEFIHIFAIFKMTLYGS